MIAHMMQMDRAGLIETLVRQHLGERGRRWAAKAPQEDLAELLAAIRLEQRRLRLRPRTRAIPEEKASRSPEASRARAAPTRKPHR